MSQWDGNICKDCVGGDNYTPIRLNDKERCAAFIRNALAKINHNINIMNDDFYQRNKKGCSKKE